MHDENHLIEFIERMITSPDQEIVTCEHALDKYFETAKLYGKERKIKHAVKQLFDALYDQKEF